MDCRVFLLVLLIGRWFLLGFNDLGSAVLHLFGDGFRMLVLVGVNESIGPRLWML